MVIKKRAYEKLLSCPRVPPEMGGILVGKDSIINTVVYDFGKDNYFGIKYVPNDVFLNRRLLKFYEEGKRFYGIFHTHAYKWDSLSNDDVRYIETIMKAMPMEIDYLYFPIVFPGDTVKSFKAQKEKMRIVISKDEIKIL